MRMNFYGSRGVCASDPAQLYQKETFRPEKGSNSVVKSVALFSLLIPVACVAQTSPENMMRQAFQRLGLSEKVSIETTGAEIRGKQLVNVRVVIGYQQVLADSLARIEVMTFEDGRLISRQAGDGLNLWDFDARANTYSSSTYATSERGLLADWKQRLFHTLRLRTSGVTAFTFRHLDDAFGTGLKDDRWVPWIPVSALKREQTNVISRAGTPALNDTTYKLAGDDESGFSIEGSEFTLYDSAGDKSVKHWETTITPGQLPENTDFGFVPPKGARAIAVDQRSGN